ncbi:hypothetical protein DFH08DRAFT_805175 [Mycena albidolilacea]|uniref:Secreted protein n=1 Tax=Mycena albidolilacea TaxID=1033008 RepID=A0AAD7EWZ6_9AGAR|nr:hypothetical protein DFH08DRAFT_805175 [Mycena albidolilacea]
MLVSNSHFVLLLPSSLVLLAAPAVWQCRAITDQLTPALLIQLIMAAVRKKEPCHGGVHTKGGGLPGGMHRTWIWACLKCARFFSGGPGADTRVHIGCTCAQLRELARQYK